MIEIDPHSNSPKPETVTLTPQELQKKLDDAYQEGRRATAERMKTLLLDRCAAAFRTRNDGIAHAFRDLADVVIRYIRGDKDF